jgi:predicted glycosyltransferase
MLHPGNKTFRAGLFPLEYGNMQQFQPACNLDGAVMPPTRDPERILVYTHNSIGLGHAVRTMAVIDGMRAMLPQTDFLVLSGGSAPAIFLNEGIETVKLPGLRHALDVAGQPFRPRYLRSLDRDAVLAWRGRLITTCLEAFRPDVVMLEHALAGLMAEAVPLLAKSRRLDPSGHVLTHLSRGIYRDKPMLLAPAVDYPGLPTSLSVPRLYDAFYVLEDRAVVDVNREFFGNDPELEARIAYLGRVSARNIEELHGARRIADMCLDRPLVLVSLGRHGRILELHARLFAALGCLPLFGPGEVLVVLDPYLSREQVAGIEALPTPVRVRFTPFIPCLAEIVAAADVVVCRAGYNTVNELLITGKPALVIPESHPSHEQERRAGILPQKQVLVMEEEACLDNDLVGPLAGLLARPTRPGIVRFDRFAVGRRIVEDLRRLVGGA